MNYQSFIKERDREREGPSCPLEGQQWGVIPSGIGPKHVLKLTQTPKTPIGVVFCSYTPT